MLILWSTAALLCGFFLDLIIGDPRAWPHIVRFFGAVIAWLEGKLYPLRSKRLGGTLLVAATLFFCTGIPALLLFAAWALSPWVYFSLELLLVWQCLAIKSLRKESGYVYDALAQKDLVGARKAVSMIVGRDTAALDEAGVARAAVETVAENTSDGVIAPLFYCMLFGAVGACFYKAANTMDSMIGYKSEKYLEFGRCAARLDDVLNFIPSRLAALLLIASARLCRLDARNALRIWKRDRRNHESPNSAQTEAAMAGALDLRLAGNASYFGIVHEKPFIGDALRHIEAEDIRRSHKMLYAASILMLLITLIVRGCVYAAI